MWNKFEKYFWELGMIVIELALILLNILLSSNQYAYADGNSVQQIGCTV